MIDRQYLKNATREWMPPILYRYLRSLKNNNAEGLKTYYALNDLDRKLEKYLDYDGGYFVELGANDGVNQSNTLFFERQRGWRGVLIEPIPHQFARCRANRAPDNAFYCNACTPFGYKERFAELIYSNLMTVSAEFSGCIDDPVAHARKGEEFLSEGECVLRFGAVARPLSEILLECGAPQLIDLLSLDVEGSELHVLQGIDHEVFHFKYMLIEHDEAAPLENYLCPFGYRLADQLSWHDWLFEGVH